MGLDDEGFLRVTNTQPFTVKGPHAEDLAFSLAGMAGSSPPGSWVPLGYGNGERIEPETAAEIRAAEWKAAYVPSPLHPLFV